MLYIAIDFFADEVLATSHSGEEINRAVFAHVRKHLKCRNNIDWTWLTDGTVGFVSEIGTGNLSVGVYQTEEKYHCFHHIQDLAPKFGQLTLFENESLSDACDMLRIAMDDTGKDHLFYRCSALECAKHIDIEDFIEMEKGKQGGASAYYDEAEDAVIVTLYHVGDHWYMEEEYK